MNKQKAFIKAKNLHGEFSIGLKRQTPDFDIFENTKGGYFSLPNLKKDWVSAKFYMKRLFYFFILVLSINLVNAGTLYNTRLITTSSNSTLTFSILINYKQIFINDSNIKIINITCSNNNQFISEINWNIPNSERDIVYYCSLSSLPPTSSSGGGLGVDLNPKNISIKYPLKWERNKNITISIETYNQLNNLYNPPLIEFEYDKNQLSLLEKIYNLDSNITKVVFLVYSNATLGDKSIKLKVNDQKTYEKEINFEIVKEEIKGKEERIKRKDLKEEIENFLVSNKNYLIISFILILILVIMLSIILVLINKRPNSQF